MPDQAECGRARRPGSTPATLGSELSLTISRPLATDADIGSNHPSWPELGRKQNGCSAERGRKAGVNSRGLSSSHSFGEGGDSTAQQNPAASAAHFTATGATGI
jgi:hypothetical protein